MKILAMSRPRQGALNKLSRNNKKIQEHIIKCVIYPNYESKKHWIKDELCNWFYQADKIQCDTKLKKQDYRNTVFGMIGNTLGESLDDLTDFKEDFVKNASNPYNDFIITDELANTLYQTYQNLISIAIKQFMDKSIKSINEWYEIINPVFK